MSAKMPKSTAENIARIPEAFEHFQFTFNRMVSGQLSPDAALAASRALSVRLERAGEPTGPTSLFGRWRASYARSAVDLGDVRVEILRRCIARHARRSK